MSHNTAFTLVRFENRNGITSWRVDGRLHGVRVRRNFKTREEAAAEKATLELQAEQAASGLRSVTTCLTNDQVRDAEAAFRRLAGEPHPLAVYLDYALANYREPAREVLLAAAIDEYVATKCKEHEQTLLSERQFRSIKYELETFKTRFPASMLAQFSPASLVAYFERGAPSLKTYNNRRGLLSTFFNFAFRKDWIGANPIEKTPYHRIRHRRGSATTITAEQASRLMAYVETFREGALVPYFALCLFAGIRPCVLSGEITKLRPEQVRLDTGVIHIEPEVSKVRTKRLVTIQPNLAAWLRAYPLDRLPIIPTNAPKIRRSAVPAHDAHGVCRDCRRTCYSRRPDFPGARHLAFIRRDRLAAHQPTRRAAHLLHDACRPIGEASRFKATARQRKMRGQTMTHSSAITTVKSRNTLHHF